MFSEDLGHLILAWWVCRRGVWLVGVTVFVSVGVASGRSRLGWGAMEETGHILREPL